MSSREVFVSQFFNLVRKEFTMSSKRISFWIVSFVLFAFYCAVEIVPFFDGTTEIIPVDQIWQTASLTVFKLNLFFPLVGGILVADRLVRDHRLGVVELQQSAPIRLTSSVLAKYLGVLASLLLPEFITVVAVAIIPIAGGLTGWAYLGAVLVSSLAISLPAMIFVTAFSLACPMVMPVRVYQVLFTGYWFWGNFLSPEVFPTVSQTLLNVAGIYPLQGFFGGTVGPGITYTALQGTLNILILLGMSAAMLTLLNVFLKNRMEKV
jgi:hypothetical protein